MQNHRKIGYLPEHNPLYLDMYVKEFLEFIGGLYKIKNTKERVKEMIYQTADKGITVFVTTHYLDEAEYCNRISIMVDGRIDALGTPRELKEKFSATSMDEVFYKLARGAKRSDN